MSTYNFKDIIHYLQNPELIGLYHIKIQLKDEDWVEFEGFEEIPILTHMIKKGEENLNHTKEQLIQMCKEFSEMLPDSDPIKVGEAIEELYMALTNTPEAKLERLRIATGYRSQDNSLSEIERRAKAYYEGKNLNNPWWIEEEPDVDYLNELKKLKKHLKDSPRYIREEKNTDFTLSMSDFLFGFDLGDDYE